MDEYSARRGNGGRFHKGRTGNPAGRPKKKGAEKPASLDQLVSIEFNGKLEKVTPEVAALLALFMQGIQQKGAHALDGFLANIDKFSAPTPAATRKERLIVRIPMRPNRPDEALGLLQIVKFSPDGYYIDDWVVEEALKRNPSIDLAGRDLSALASVTANKPLAAARLLVAKQKAAKLGGPRQAGS